MTATAQPACPVASHQKTFALVCVLFVFVSSLENSPKLNLFCGQLPANAKKTPRTAAILTKAHEITERGGILERTGSQKSCWEIFAYPIPFSMWELQTAVVAEDNV